MIDAALLRACGAEERSGSGEARASNDRREACAFALAAVKAGEALMDEARFARVMARIEGVGAPRRRD
ncbi:MAG: hypothetical protein AAF763_03025 [Pseudomonadota bacterium]